MRGVLGLDALFARKGDAAPAVQAAIPPTRPNRFEALARTLGYGTLAQETGMDPSPPLPAIDGDADDPRVTPFRRPTPAIAVTHADEPVAQVAMAGTLVDATPPDPSPDATLVAQHRPRPPGWGQSGTVRPAGGSVPRSPTTLPADPTEHNRLGSAWTRRRTPPSQVPTSGETDPPPHTPLPEPAVPPEASPVLSADMIRRGAPQRPAESGRPWQRVRDALGGPSAEAAAAAPTEADARANAPMPRSFGSDAAMARTGVVSEASPVPVTPTGAPDDGDHLDISLFATSSTPGADHETTTAGPAPTSAGMPASTPSEAPSEAPNEAPRRRHVSVRLPDREHGLLRQFAHLCGTTQQDVVRRALLTYMMNELQRRLDATPSPPSGATPGDWARFSHGLTPATDRSQG